MALSEDIIALARQYGRYGYRRVTALLGDAGWTVNRKRIWRREGLKVPQKQPRRSCSSLAGRQQISGLTMDRNLLRLQFKNGWLRAA